jgi:outer membrane protein assembly factor BamB
MTHFGSTPAVVAGVVVVGPDDGHMYGLDANTGELKWTVDCAAYVSIKVNLGQHEIRSSPVIHEGFAYVADLLDTLYCVDPLTGAVMWKTNIGSFAPGSVDFDDTGALFIMTAANRMYKINANPSPASGGGTILLNFSVSMSGSGFFSFGYASYTPNYYNGVIYYGCTGNYIRGYNATDGTIVLQASQPFVLSENSHGSTVILPGASNMLSPINQTLSAPTMKNGTVWTGIPITYFNTTSTAQVPGYQYYKGQYFRHHL